METTNKKLCEICGKELTKTQRWKKQRFCSYACSLKRKIVQLNRKGKIIAVCPVCGTRFTTCEARQAIGRGVYCSRKCDWAHRKETMDYGYNTEFMDQENEISAYFLGVFVTDGHLSKDKQVVISMTDKQIVYDIATATKYTKKIGEGHPKPPRKTKYILNYAGASADKLITMGFHCGIKTGKEFTPDFISDSTFSHYIRGVTDGDGCFYFDSDTGALRYSLVSMNKKFLDDILARLQRLKVVTLGSVGQNTKSNGTVLPTLGFGANDAIKLGKYMYADCSLFLRRKFDVYTKGAERGVFHETQLGKTCSVSGCDKPADSKGLCTYHYIAARPGRKEYMEKYLKEYYKRNAEKLCLASREYAANHKEEVNRKHKEYYAKNKEKILQQEKEKRIAKKEAQTTNQEVQNASETEGNESNKPKDENAE